MQDLCTCTSSTYSPGLTTQGAGIDDRPADSAPMPSCHEWKLGADVTLQVHQNPGVPAGHGSLALVVDDLDAAITDAPGEFGEITTVPGFVRTATTGDGNLITLVQTIGWGITAGM